MKNVLSLFDGMSCLQQALKGEGIKYENYYASEIDKYAIQITQKNFPNTIQLGDVKEITKDTFKDIDLICGGSPCQDLSIAGKRAGLQGERSGLFYEFVRLVKEIKPKYFILENVNSMSKENKRLMTEALFNIEPIMIDASLVSAQSRKRLFWVGALQENGEYKKVDITLPEDRGILLKDILENDVDEKYLIKNERKNTFYTNKPQRIENRKAQTLLVDETNPIIRVGHFNSGSQGNRIYSPEGKSVSLASNGAGLYFVGNEYNQRVFTDKSGTIGTSMSRTSKQGIGIYQNEISETGFIRKLTPIECERLQSVDDNYTKGVSDTQRYKMLGNGFNVEVIRHIIKQIVDK